jgi:hypothetical protein
LETGTSNKSDKTPADAAQHVAEARNLLQTLRSELNEHPGLEEAIAKLEAALNILSVKSGGLL